MIILNHKQSYLKLSYLKLAKTNFIPNKTHGYNGCGTRDFRIDFSLFKHLAGFNYCCIVHDLCYGNCNSTKSACDQNFSLCLDNSCTIGYGFLRFIGKMFIFDRVFFII